MRDILKDHPAIRGSEQGYTLVELSVVFVIIGLIIAGLFPLYTNYTHQVREKKLETTMNAVRSALFDYVVDDPLKLSGNNELRYPCPASRSAAIGSSDFGIEHCAAGTPAGSCSDGVCVAAGTDGKRVLIGTVPTVELGLATELMFDPYGHRLTYAVTAELTEVNAMNTANVSGGITILGDISDGETPRTITDKAQFTLLSHGRNGAGAYSIEGVQIGTNCSAGLEGESSNCKDTATFRYNVAYNLAETSANYYDDKVAFRLNDDRDDQWWRQTDAGGNHIVNKNPGNVGLGMALINANANRYEDPTQKLDVNGNARSRQSMLADENATATLAIDAGAHVNAGSNVSAGSNVIAGQDTSSGRNTRAPGQVTAGLDVNAGQDVTAGRDIRSLNLIATNNIEASYNVEADKEIKAIANLRAQQNAYAKNFLYGTGSYSDNSTTGNGNVTSMCGPGNILTGINAGTPICEPDFTLANLHCPVNEYVYGFNEESKPVCKPICEEGEDCASDGDGGNCQTEGPHYAYYSSPYYYVSTIADGDTGSVTSNGTRYMWAGQEPCIQEYGYNTAEYYQCTQRFAAGDTTAGGWKYSISGGVRDSFQDCGDTHCQREDVYAISRTNCP